jgi:hypothetical protein
MLGLPKRGGNSRVRHKPTPARDAKVKLGGASVADQLRRQPETCCSAREIEFYSAAT